ncbi:hypothetical protein ACRE_081770 [Hapsidospora chrysogenum ATCC 11550]|uniref:Uncharacterized protein n=1 Tax=Hapsidospora chrysogenum (strain ATCC 11550 / CBS 779.69 / DSM 880 / IAM 14645 / JCM 23072 / IMI 49137) TaxID=857340 RepID=A0A086SVI1_HAPC1|nr:hypothetical protein ACRE_081770 [Hapsidospora chrysogenum ATCC 11550]
MGEQKKPNASAEEDRDIPPIGESQSGIRDGKGKGKEEGPSNFDRLQASANMAKDAFVGTTGGVLPGTLLSSSSSSGKATAAGPGASRDPASVLQQTSMVRPSQPNTSSRGADLFRNPPPASSSSREFDEFLSGREPQLPRDPAGGAPAPAPHFEQTIRDFEATDGAAVVDLLSQPPQLEDMLADDDQDEQLTPAAAAKLREALFSSPGNRIAWDDLLNFTPGFVARPGDGAQEARAQLGTEDPDGAREIWLRQWRDVLSAYTDEVWGDLGPLAAEAKRELESSGPSGGVERADGALGRLRMILAHVRGSV